MTIIIMVGSVAPDMVFMFMVCPHCCCCWPQYRWSSLVLGGSDHGQEDEGGHREDRLHLNRDSQALL